MLYRMMDDGRWKLATGTQRLTLAPGGWTCDGKPISKNEYLLADAGWRLVSWRWVYKIGHPKRVVPVCSLLITRDDLRHLDALQCLVLHATDYRIRTRCNVFRALYHMLHETRTASKSLSHVNP